MRTGRAQWAGIVAAILAIGIATAVNAITFAVLYDAIEHPEQAGLSDNATQIMTTAFGGIIGVLGSYVGYRAGKDRNDDNGRDNVA